ncbi:MAG: rhomboid family intramembrane serine protease [Reichenbachiella sp.]
MSITLIIIIATVLISMSAMKDPALQYKLIMNPVAVRHGQWYRMVTSGFIHSNWAHLGFNMITLFFFGQNVEHIFQAVKGSSGGIYFVAFYILSIIISDLVSVFKHKDNPRYNSLGASGGVSAIVFSSILFFPTESICLYGFICLPGFILGGIYIVYSYLKGQNLSDNVNHDAHLFGAVFGLVFSVMIDPGVLMRFVRQIAEWNPFS